LKKQPPPPGFSVFSKNFPFIAFFAKAGKIFRFFEKMLDKRDAFLYNTNG
jgi:hypothetical protein